ncbi:MAG: hypothetical protein GXO97_04265 [Nitrospirae bacterium]|nr:hypothetical protein [Nitrospirota bacterium]
MDISLLFEVFFIFSAGSIVMGLFLSDRRSPVFLAFTASISSILLLWLSGESLFTGQTLHGEFYRISSLSVLSYSIDRLSSLFMFITALVYLPVSIYSAGYLKKYPGRYRLTTFSVLYHLLFVSIVLILTAADVVTFLLSWEVMSITCYLLVNYEYDKEENIRSGLLMLTMSEAGFLAVTVGFLILAKGAGSLDFASLRLNSQKLGDTSLWVSFMLFLIGFGVKAGLVPVNAWLPRAYASAPSNFSAILSGATLNLGIYGIIRINAEILQSVTHGTGVVVLVAGSVSALVGILYAVTEDDMKRMLAHSSIENSGIILTGLGAGLVFRETGHYVLAGIAFIASLYHMVNHSLFKTLLFLGAGGIELKTTTRSMNRLGGIFKLMPWTGLFFLVGAISIAALPPFNGFVSEWLSFQSLLQASALRSVPVKVAFALSGAMLALTAGLAVTCFVKAFSMSFLGIARSEDARRAVELPFRMKLPMGFLALLCLISGILPTYIIPVIDTATAPLSHQSVVDELVPPFFQLSDGSTKFSKEFISDFHDLGAQVGKDILPGRGLVVLHRGTEKNPVVYAMSTSYTIVVLILLIGAVYITANILTRKRKVTIRTCWNGGLRQLLPEMTYTATGFSNPVRVIFSAIFRPSIVRDTRTIFSSRFRAAIMRERKEIHIVDRLFIQPVLKAFRTTARLAASMHTGSVNIYAMYVIISLVLVLIVGEFI